MRLFQQAAREIRFIVSSVTSVWLLLPQSAYALGDDVLIYTGNSGFAYLRFYAPDPFLDVMTGEGCASEGIEDSSGFPTDLSDYSIVMLLLNSARFTSSEVSLMS
ncbi:MAG: hypothetical protein AAFV53_10105, partial [Myxococcota bacterium]